MKCRYTFVKSKEDNTRFSALQILCFRSKKDIEATIKYLEKVLEKIKTI